MIDEIKIMLGDAVDNFTDAQIELFIKQTTAEVQAYTNRSPIDDYELQSVIQRLVIIKLNRLNSEGLVGFSAGGVSENYIDGYPADILAVLNRKRKIKFV